MALPLITRRGLQARITRAPTERLLQKFQKAHLSWMNRARPTQPLEDLQLTADALAKKRLACTIERQTTESCLFRVLEMLDASLEHCKRHEMPFSVEAYLTLADLIARIVLEKVEDSPLVLKPHVCLADGFTDQTSKTFRKAILQSPPREQANLLAFLEKIVSRLRTATGLGIERLWRWEEIEILEQRGLLADWGATHLVLPVQEQTAFLSFMKDHVLARPESLFENLLQRATNHATSDVGGQEKNKENYAQIPLQWLNHLATIIRDHPQTAGLERLDVVRRLPDFCAEFFRFCPKIAGLFSFELFFWPIFAVFDKPISSRTTIQNAILQGLVDELGGKNIKALAAMGCDKTLFAVLSPLFSAVLWQQNRPVHRTESEILSPKQWAALARRLRILPDPIRSQFFKLALGGGGDAETLRSFLGLQHQEINLRTCRPGELDLELQD